jgi:hypothetical protein
MNQLELILENIRLSHIEKILLESSTQMEAQRGIDLINESIYTVGSLVQENRLVNMTTGSRDQGDLMSGIGSVAGLAGGALLGNHYVDGYQDQAQDDLDYHTQRHENLVNKLKDPNLGYFETLNTQNSLTTNAQELANANRVNEQMNSAGMTYGVPAAAALVGNMVGGNIGQNLGRSSGLISGAFKRL